MIHSIKILIKFQQLSCGGSFFYSCRLLLVSVLVCVAVVPFTMSSDAARGEQLKPACFMLFHKNVKQDCWTYANCHKCLILRHSDFKLHVTKIRLLNAHTIGPVCINSLPLKHNFERITDFIFLFQPVPKLQKWTAE